MQSHVPSTTTLSPSADVALVIEDAAGRQLARFNVHAETLKRKSRYFHALLGRNFDEGRRLQEAGYGSVVLKEDDPTIMWIILSLLHDHEVDIDFGTSMDGKLDRLFWIAVHCDKYDCNAALRGHIARWSRLVQDATWTNDIGLRLTIAYLLHTQEWLQSLSDRVMTEFRPNF